MMNNYGVEAQGNDFSLVLQAKIDLLQLCLLISEKGELFKVDHKCLAYRPQHMQSVRWQTFFSAPQTKEDKYRISCFKLKGRHASRQFSR